MNVTVLGCGDAFGSGGRYHTSFLLSSEGEHVLLDCGASTLIRLKQEGIILEDISTIILSHFHGDHYGGVPFFLISSLFENERKRPLKIIGPVGVKERVENLLDAMYPGTVERLGPFAIEFYSYNDESLIVGDKGILALPVRHSEPSIPYGVRLSWRDKVIAFSGDTSWCENLIQLSDHADLFICECNFLDQEAFGHLSYHELLEKKSQISCENIWLTHMNERVINASEVVFNKLDDGMKLII